MNEHLAARKQSDTGAVGLIRHRYRALSPLRFRYRRGCSYYSLMTLTTTPSASTAGRVDEVLPSSSSSLPAAQVRSRVTSLPDAIRFCRFKGSSLSSNQSSACSITTKAGLSTHSVFRERQSWRMPFFACPLAHKFRTETTSRPFGAPARLSK